MGWPKKDNHGGPSTYSIIRAPGFKMDLHKRQQHIILSELNASREKLQQENQMLRDELAEAKMIIRLLKMRLDESKKVTSFTPVESRDGGVTAKLFTSPERTRKRRYLFKQKSAKQKDAFRNPRPPGAKTFSPQRSISPPKQKRRLSPSASFTPIRRDDERNITAGKNVTQINEMMVQDVLIRMERAGISK